ncbi:hypothetical protein CK203_068460 [Vitis vinifera]|uniref:Reverse transcriptase zinc-binding domain-containing protein n=1 Tax=Vitis vinifera TaxID=29760 RepID=A0A438F347_VITVI|nr:hypothetical protein CK203_068460 [Vitis vinifera]
MERGVNGVDDPIVGTTRDAKPLEVSAVVERGSMTDEALRVEASRHVEYSALYVRGRELSSSSLSSGLDQAGAKEGALSGLVSMVEGEEQLPLSIILADESNEELGTEGLLGEVSKFLGFSTEGFEGKLLNLLLRTKRRREQNIKKDISGTTKFDHELKKLEWSLNYNDARKEKSLGDCSQTWSGKMLRLEAMSARGAAGGMVVFWDKRVLELVGMEVPFEGCGSILGVLARILTWSDFPQRHSREGRLTGSLRRFSEAIEESRLDCFLVSEDWENHFSGAIQCSLPRPVSDHFPILLDGGGVRSGPSPFRFENMWLKEEGLALEKVSYWDNQERLRVLNEQELEARKEAREDFKKWVLMEEISRRQKSRETWLKEGDKNTGFFHKMANANRMRNCLKKIKVNSTWLTEDQDIQKGVVRAFQNLLSEPGGWRPCLNTLEFDSIGIEEATRLEEMFSVEEVFLALAKLNRDKAPGPDGFSFAFWQFCWDFVKVEVLANRLKKVMGKVVSSIQSAFIEGLRINLNKSEILPVGRVENAELLATELGCKVGSLPSTYLGLPLGASHKSMRVWDGVEARMRKRLALALLCKWSWRFAVERDSYWKLIISTKFGIKRGGWSTRGVREGYGVGLWKEISKEGLLLLNNVSFSVGDGKRYNLAVSKDAWVADYWDSTGEEGEWTPRFLRPFNDWEMEKVERFLSTIQGKRLNAESSLVSMEDYLESVCSYKGGFFCLGSFMGKVLTQDQLKRRGWYLANRCFLCCAKEETINHFLIQFSKAKILWDLVFSLFGVNWVLPFTVRDTLLGWHITFKDKKHRKVWRAAPLCLFWTV